MAKLFFGLASGLLALTAAASGPAQQAPANLRPTRDVALEVSTTLRGAGGTGLITGRVAWLAAEDLVRIETHGVPGWTLLDRKRGRATMVMDDRRAAVRLPPETAALMLREIPADARFSRQGTEVVAGHACLRWRVALPHGDSVLCLTRDGVMLRWTPVGDELSVPESLSGEVEATAVSYRPQDPARFRVPAEYATAELPL